MIIEKRISVRWGKATITERLVYPAEQWATYGMLAALVEIDDCELCEAMEKETWAAEGRQAYLAYKDGESAMLRVLALHYPNEREWFYNQEHKP